MEISPNVAIWLYLKNIKAILRQNENKSLLLPFILRDIKQQPPPTERIPEPKHRQPLSNWGIPYNQLSQNKNPDS